MFGLLPQLFGFPLFLGDDPCIQRSFQSDRLVVSQDDKKKIGLSCWLGLCHSYSLQPADDFNLAH